MKPLIDPVQLRKSLDAKFEEMERDSVIEEKDMTTFFANSSKRKQLMQNRIKDVAFCIKQVNHEIIANDVLVKQLQENAKEEEKKLDDYPKRIEQIDKQIKKTRKQIERYTKEKELIKSKANIANEEWEDKMNALTEALGFSADISVHDVLLQYEKNLGNTTKNKETVKLVLKEGSYEAGDTSTKINNFESYVRKLNRGMPFAAFCWEIKKSLENSE